MVCSSGKIVFNCRPEAIAYNKWYGKRHNIWYDIYLCPICGKFHLTSRGKKKKADD